MLLFCLPVSAQGAYIAIGNVEISIKSGTVKIEGKTTVGIGRRSVVISVTDENTDFDDTKSLVSGLQNAGMVKTDVLGNFEYDFEITYHSNTNIENYKIRTALANNGAIDERSFSCIGEEAYNAVKNSSIIMSDKSRNVQVYGNTVLADNAPFSENNTFYADAHFIADQMGGTFTKEAGGFTVNVGGYEIKGTDNGGVTVNGEAADVRNCIYKNASYIDIKAFEKTGKYVYVGENVFAICNYAVDGSMDNYFDNFGIYVSNNGNDTNSGRANSPLKSFEKALEKVDENDSFEDNRIYVMGGEYFIDKTIDISNKKNLTIENYANERVALKGSIKLDKEDFVSADPAELPNTMSDKVKSKIKKLDLNKYIDVKSARQLGYNNYYKVYENKTADVLARYPNAEYTAECRKAGQSVSNGFTLNDRVAKWGDVSNAWIGGALIAPFFYNRFYIHKNTENTFVLEEKDTKCDVEDTNIVVYNIFEELDLPGEWYIDPESGTLYLYPTSDLGNVEITVADSSILNIENSENIKISDIEIGWNNKTAVLINSSKDVKIDSVTIRATSGYGVIMSDSQRAAVKNSELYDIAMGGVKINASCGDSGKHIAGGCGIENCHIYNFADENSNMAGVDLQGIGNFARHNVIHDSMSQGVLVYDYDNVVENNEIYNVVRDIFDGGAIYIGGFGFMGIQIRSNYIHDIFKSHRGWGRIYSMYADNAAPGITFENNVVTQVGLYGGGRNNTIKNNIFIDSNIEYDKRALLGDWYRKNTNLYPQIVNKPGFDRETWYKEHPELKEMVEDCEKEKEYLNSAVTDENGNVTYTKEKFDAGEPKNVSVSDNLVISDTRNVNLNPVGLWWNPETEYGTEYKSNLGVMKSSYQKIDRSSKTVHSGNGSMRYEIINDNYKTVIKPISDELTYGEFYKVSAWIYAQNIKSNATAEITVNGNPNLQPYSYPYVIEGSGETTLQSGKWQEIYCYWASNKNNNKVTLYFPQASVGDVFYIDDIAFEKINVSELGSVKELMNTNMEGEYKYVPDTLLDLSETEQALEVGKTAKVKANVLVDESVDSDNDGIIRDTELKITTRPATGLSFSSNNTSILEVSADGVMTAKDKGMVILTVTDDSGNTATITVSCYDSSYGIDYINDAKGVVKDVDPLYGNEVMRAYYSSGTDTGYIVSDGMTLNFQYYDNGVQDDKGDNTITVGFNLPNLTAILWWDSIGNGKINRTPAGTPDSIRISGWHQISCIFTEKSDGDFTAQWYYDGRKGFKNTVPKGTAVRFIEQIRPGRNPLYIKDLFVVAKGATETDQTNRTIVFDGFDEGISGWTTDKIGTLDSVFNGTKTQLVNDYEAWFEDVGNGNYQLTEYGINSITDIMPTFKSFDFNGIGNTEKIGGDMKAPILKAPIEKEAVSGEIKLYWNEVPGAAKYVVKISRSEDMTDVVYTQTVNTNTAAVELDETGAYYWTVTAQNLSKQYKSEVTSEPESFIAESGLKFNSVAVKSVDENTSEAVFTYDVSVKSVNAKAILVEKTMDGKIVNVTVKDDLNVSDKKLNIGERYAKENFVECYIWQDLLTMKPLTLKQSSNTQ